MRIARLWMTMVFSCTKLDMNLQRLVSMQTLRSAFFVFVCESRFQRVLRTMATGVGNMATIEQAKELGVFDVEQKLKRTCTHYNSALPLVSASGMLDALTEAAESSIFLKKH